MSITDIINDKKVALDERRNILNKDNVIKVKESIYTLIFFILKARIITKGILNKILVAKIFLFPANPSNLLI